MFDTLSDTQRKIVSEKDEQSNDKLPMVQAEEEIPDISIMETRRKFWML